MEITKTKEKYNKNTVFSSPLPRNKFTQVKECDNTKNGGNTKYRCVYVLYV